MTEVELLGKVFDALPVGVVLLDEHAKVVFYNRAEEQLAGRKRQNVIGRSFFEEVAPCTNVAGLGIDYQALVADGALRKSLSFRFPKPFIEKPRDVRLLLEGMEIHGRPYGLLMVQDVSAVRAVERTKDYLVRMLAHDMNNPLTVVSLAFDLLHEENDAGEDEMWASGQYASQRLRDMVVNLFDITRLQTADVPSRMTPQDIVPMLSTSVAMAHGLADPAHVQLQLVSAPSLSMDCDRELLRRAIDNLLDNAIRYSPPEGRVILRAAKEGTEIVFQVEDDGPGIPPEVRRALFQPFTRGDLENGDAKQHDAKQHDANHHGLGLAFVDLVAREHGGSVTVDCPSRGGSVFTLRLPLKTQHFEITPRDHDIEHSDAKS